MKEKISLQEDFVFGSVMSNRKLCQRLIQLILPELKIERIEFPTLQKRSKTNRKTMEFVSMSIPKIKMVCMKSICRCDQLRGSLNGFVIIKAGLLNHGEPYAGMKKTYVIFICPFDLHGEGLHKYEFRNLCIDQPTLEMQDGRTTIFLNTKGIKNDVSKALQNFLHYVDNKDVQDDQYVDELRDYIHQLSQNRRWRNEYMDNKTHMMFHDEDIREEGRQEGIQIGEESGIKKGKTQAILQMITITRQLGIPKDQLQQKIKQQFHLSDDEIKALFE